MWFQKQPPGVFYKKGVTKNFSKFTGKYLCQSLFLDLWSWSQGSYELVSLCPFVGKFSQFFVKLTMFLGAYVVGERFAPEMRKMGQKNRLFKIYWKIQSLIFSEFERKFILFDAFLHKLHIWEKFDFGDIDQDALGQSNCWNFISSTISLEQNDKKA